MEPAEPNAQPEEQAPQAAALMHPVQGILLGGPSQSFFSRVDRHYHYIPVLAVAAALAARCRHLLTLAAATWLFAYGAAVLAASLWQALAGPHLPARAESASYARWQELPAVLLRVSSFGLGLGWALTRLMLDDDGMFAEPPAGSAALAAPPAPGALARLEAAAWHIATMLFASGAVSLVFTMLCMRVRVSLCLVVQLTLTATAWPFNRSMCAAVPLASAAARDRNERIFVFLSALLLLLPLSAGVSGSLPASADDACVAVVALLQLGLGTLIPVLMEGLHEARLFRLHQRQRRQAGVPPERGWQASLYNAVSFCTRGGSASDAGLCCFALLCACWDVCTVFARSSL